MIFLSVCTIDLGILAVFLVVTLVVGLRYGRQVKTLQAYALGGKNFATTTLVATIVATWASGSGCFIDITNTYTRGFNYLIPCLGMPISLWLSGQLAMRMREFMNHVSVAEAIGKVYGKAVQLIAALGGIIAGIGIIAVQFKAMAAVFTLFWGLDNIKASVVAAIVTILYSSFGGIKAVTFTDVLQFSMFGTVLPLLALAIWNHIQDPHQLVATVLKQNPLFSLKKVVGCTPQFGATLGLLLYYAVPAMNPTGFQRIAMARDVRQAKHAFTYAAGTFLLILALMAWVGMLLLADHPGLASSEVVPYMINHHTYTGLKGLLGAGLMALAMSTADSKLNAGAVLFANDVVKSVTGQAKGSTKMAKACTVVTGLVALILSLYKDDFLSLVLLSASFFMPLVTVPMLLAVLGFRSTPKVALIGMAAGFTTVVLWSHVYTNGTSIAPGMAANLLFLLGSHYLLGEPGGWQQPASSPLALARAERKEAWKAAPKSLPNLFKPYPYLQKNLPKQEIAYTLLGLYTLVATYTAFYTLDQADVKAHQAIYNGISQLVMVAASFFLTFPIWPPTVKSERFMTFFWPIGMGGILFFVGTLLVIISHFHETQVMVLMINLLMAVLLLRGPLALILAFGGVALAVWFFQHYTGALFSGSALGSWEFRVVYSLLLVSSVLIALFKDQHSYRALETRSVALAVDKQEAMEALLASFKEKANFVKAFQQSGAPTLNELTGLSRRVAAWLASANAPQSVTNDMSKLTKQLSSTAVQLDRIDHRAAGYLRLEVDTIALTDFLEGLQDKLRAKGIEAGIHFKKATQQKTLQCDGARIKQLLVNSVSFLRRILGEASPILLSVEDTQLAYPLASVKEDYTKKIAALRFTITTAPTPPQLAQCYTTQVSDATTPMPQTTCDLPLAQNQRIVGAHYGLGTTIAQDSSLTLLYVVPVALRKVRPKDMDLAEMELGAELTRADDTYPGAQAQEQAFLAAVAQKTRADLALVRQAIEVIKQYHGPVRRRSGEPFYLHPLAVAHIVLDYNQDEATVLGALLHDTVEDTPMLLANIETLFGQEVSGIVDGVTHLDSNKDTFYKVKLSTQENILMLLGVADQRVLYVKLADRMHNMRTIQYKPAASQHRTAEETLLFFVPLAQKLGLKAVAEELKTLCLKVFASSLP